MKSPLQVGKTSCFVVSTHFQLILKVAQNSQNFGEMVLVHQVKMVFTWANFSADSSFSSLESIFRKMF